MKNISKPIKVLLILILLILGKHIASRVFNTHKYECRLVGGEWLEEFKECEKMGFTVGRVNLNRFSCFLIGGTKYDFCGSGCRHNPEPVDDTAPVWGCPAACLQVCYFK